MTDKMGFATAIIAATQNNFARVAIEMNTLVLFFLVWALLTYLVCMLHHQQKQLQLQVYLPYYWKCHLLIQHQHNQNNLNLSLKESLPSCCQHKHHVLALAHLTDVAQWERKSLKVAFHGAFSHCCCQSIWDLTLAIIFLSAASMAFGWTPFCPVVLTIRFQLRGNVSDW